MRVGQKVTFQTDKTDTVVTSCGCVFCDLDLAPIKSSTGKLMHGDKERNQWVPCTKTDK